MRSRFVLGFNGVPSATLGAAPEPNEARCRRYGATLVSAAPCSLYLNSGAPCSFISAAVPHAAFISVTLSFAWTQGMPFPAVCDSSVLSLAFISLRLPFFKAATGFVVAAMFELASASMAPNAAASSHVSPWPRPWTLCSGAVSLVLGEDSLHLYFTCLGSFDVRLKLRHLRRRGGNALRRSALR